MRATKRNRNTPEMFEERERVRGKVTWNVNVTLIENLVCSIESYSSTKCNDTLTAYICSTIRCSIALLVEPRGTLARCMRRAFNTNRSSGSGDGKNATHRILGWLQQRLERLRAKPTNCTNREDDNVITYKDNHVSVFVGEFFVAQRDRSHRQYAFHSFLPTHRDCRDVDWVPYYTLPKLLLAISKEILVFVQITGSFTF